MLIRLAIRAFAEPRRIAMKKNIYLTTDTGPEKICRVLHDQESMAKCGELLDKFLTAKKFEYPEDQIHFWISDQEPADMAERQVTHEYYKDLYGTAETVFQGTVTKRGYTFHNAATPESCVKFIEALSREHEEKYGRPFLNIQAYTEKPENFEYRMLWEFDLDD